MSTKECVVTISDRYCYANDKKCVSTRVLSNLNSKTNK